jgi:hypothetical protein
MSTYSIWIVSPDGYIHSHAFDEVAISLQAAFHELGLTAEIVHDPEKIQGQPIILGCNLLSRHPEIRIPKDPILFNLEQVLPGSNWISAEYIQLLQRYRIWDYSKANLREWNALGVKDVTYCGIGYTPALSQLQPAKQQDIDVLLYGSLNDRRMAIINEMKNQGAHAEAVFNVYGEERDRLISRSKIVINVHYYEGKVFEIVRVSYLLANRVFVVAERGSDRELEKQFESGLVFAPYKNLVNETLHFLKKEDLRKKIAERGFQNFQKIRQSDLLAQALKSMG